MTVNPLETEARTRVFRRMEELDAALNKVDAAVQSRYYRRAYELMQNEVAYAVEYLDDATYQLVDPPRLVMK